MRTRSIVLALAIVALFAAVVTLFVAPKLLPGLRPAPRPEAGTLPSLERAGPWRNGAPLTADSLRHRGVVLLLWGDTDPRALAALQVADAWYRAYAPLGARIVAVHEPEFAFASDTAIAGSVARRLRLVLPIVEDANHFVADALGGTTDGPHVVVADETGRIVADSVGGLAAAQRALREIVHRACPDEPLPPELDTTLPGGVRTIPLGAGRVGDGPLAGLPAGQERVFTAEFRYQEQGRAWVPYPVGAWKPGREGVEAVRGGAANFVAIRYSAGRAGVVVTPPRGAHARLWILRDDHWPRPDELGEDARQEAGGVCVEVTEPRLYWIDRGSGERVLKLSPEAPGTTLNAFVFSDAFGPK